MPAKLTLTINQEVIKAARAYAQKQGKSLSELIGNYLRALTSKTSNGEDLSRRVKKLKGTINLSEDFDYKKSLTEALAKKYSK